jgi:hypothetical protein
MIQTERPSWPARRGAAMTPADLAAVLSTAGPAVAVAASTRY